MDPAIFAPVVSDPVISNASRPDKRALPRIGILVAVVATVALAGCGRKGPLELPPGAPQTTQSPGAAAAQENRVLPVVDDPALVQPPGTYVQQTRSAETQNLKGPINAPTTIKTGKPFLLDPLL